MRERDKWRLIPKWLLMDKEGERWKHKWKAMKIQLDKKEQVQEWDWFTCKDIPFHKENTFLRYELITSLEMKRKGKCMLDSVDPRVSSKKMKNWFSRLVFIRITAILW